MDSLGEAFAELGDAFSGIGGAIMDGLQAAAAGIADFADSLGDAVQDFLDGLLGAGDAEAAEPGQDGAPRPLNQGQPLSPLVLDLDGDGVELTGQAPGTTAYFDLDGDGFAERTGWVEADDGLLALDRDGNGRIDDISELFGTNDPSSNGFVPLAALDTNANGRIDAQDARFAELRVWRDADQDGVSDAGELKSLGELGIASIGLGYSVTSVTDQSNRISEVATFTRTDGSTGQVADVWFDNSQIDTRWRGEIVLDTRTYALPVLRGYGEVLPLSLAMSADEQLLQMVADLTFAPAPVAPTFAARVEAILLRWAGADGVDPTSRGAYVDARHLVALEAFTGQDFVSYRLGGGGGPNPAGDAQGNFVEVLWRDFVGKTAVRLLMQGPLAPALADLRYDAESGNVFGTPDPVRVADALGRQVAAAGLDVGSPEGWRAFVASWQGLAASFDLARGSLGLDGAAYDAELSRVLAAQGLPVAAATLRALAFPGGGAGTDAADLLAGTAGADTLAGGRGHDLLRGFAGDDNLNGGWDNDLLLGDQGNDTLVGDLHHDRLEGGPGDDRLDGGAGNDALLGGEGADTLLGGYDQDTLDGGSGNDRLEGGSGDDTYLINRGTGQETVLDTGGADTLQFGEGIARAEVSFARNGTSLLVGVAGGDRVTVERQFDDNYTNYRIETFRFADGTTLGWLEVQNLLLAQGATAGDDVILGYLTDDVIFGGGGNDRIEGGRGNDTLQGEEGNDNLLGRNDRDTLAGGLGDDSLDGGSGDDSLAGGDGNDTLLGSSDHDALDGGQGNDLLNGGSGNDLLRGGIGADTLVGGSGNDIFRFAEIDGSVDRITDLGTGDRVELAGILAGYSDAQASAFMSVRNSGTGLVLALDPDGPVGGTAFADFALFDGLAGTSLDVLLGGGRLTVA